MLRADVEGTGNVARSSGLPARQSSTLPMSGMWKRSHGGTTKAPPNERAATDMFYLTPPRHISTLPKADITSPSDPYCRPNYISSSVYRNNAKNTAILDKHQLNRPL